MSHLKTDQFIYELSQLNDDTGTTTEARMGIIPEMPELRAMLDFFLCLLVVLKLHARMRWRNITGTLYMLMVGGAPL